MYQQSQQRLGVQQWEIGPRHRNVISDEQNPRQELGELDGTRVLQERVVDARRSFFGETHPLTLSAMSDLAEILCAQGEFGAASELQEFVLDTSIQILGEEHPDTLLAEDRYYETLLETGAFLIY